MIKNIKATIKGAKAMYRMTTGNSEYRQDAIDGVAVLVQDDAIDSMGGIYALAGKNLLGREIICVSEDLFKAPRYVQKFVVRHEEGHISLGHLEQKHGHSKRIMMLLVGQVSNTELEADLYAAKKVGFEEAVHALIYLRILIQQRYKKGSSTREVENRIAALRGHMN